MAALQRLPHNINITDTLKTVIDTTSGHINNMVYDILNILGVNKVSHTKLRSKRNPRRIDIYTNYPRRADHFCTLNNIESNTTEAKNSYRRSGFYLHSERHCTYPSSDTTADVANFVKRCILSHFGKGNFR